MNVGKFRNIKVRVPTAKINRYVQEALFKDGCGWPFSKQNVSVLFAKFLYVDGDGEISWSDHNAESFFVNYSHTEVSAEDIINNRLYPFTKSDLIAGKHIVKDTRGDMYIVLANGLLYDKNGTGWLSLKKYNEELEYPDDDEFNIIEVYELKEFDDRFMFTDEFLTSVWKIKTVTKSEVYEKFGERVNIIGDDAND